MTKTYEGPITFTDSSAKTVREEVLDEAKKIVVGDRQDQYGDPSENLRRIARYWDIYLADALKNGRALDPTDVAHMMILVKLARHAKGYKHDSEVDIAGYAAIAAEASERR